MAWSGDIFVQVLQEFVDSSAPVEPQVFEALILRATTARVYDEKRSDDPVRREQVRKAVRRYRENHREEYRARDRERRRKEALAAQEERVYKAAIKQSALARKKGKIMREKLPDTRPGLTLHFTILAKDPEDRSNAPRLIEVDGYLTTGVYEDGRLGEVFVRVSKEAAALGPMMDQWAMVVSVALQHGVPVRVILEKHIATRFEPSGAVTGVAGTTRCSSPLDLICRWLIEKYGENQP